MELLNVDHQRLPKPDDFPQHIAPFPDATDFADPHLTSVIHSPENMTITHCSNMPPQKLRPIRCSGKGPPSYIVDDPPNNGGFDGTLENFVEAGISGEQLCSVNVKPKQYLEFPDEAQVGELADNPVGGGGGGGGGAGSEGAIGLMVDNQGFVGSGMSRENWGPDSGGLDLLDGSSSSSESNRDDTSAAGNEVPANQKRKRMSREKVELFLESLVTKVMRKQEQMHQQLIEIIEKRERERIVREEVWKRHEIERVKKDQELRAQETSRNLALISFIQNILGHEIEIPVSQSSLVSYKEEDSCQGGSEIHVRRENESDPNRKRWPDSEVQALIMLRTTLEQKFRVLGSKCSVWDEISIGMCNMGYNRSAKKCKEKWENINKYFRKSMENGKKGKTCPYFHELEILYKNGLVNPANSLHVVKPENEAKSERE